jgi:acyl-coenzyme A thioesterase PaaI-like protein
MTRSTQKWPPVDVEPAEIHPKAPAPGSKLGVHFAECFGCGDELEAGLHIRSMIGEGHVLRSQFLVTAAHQGAPGLAHGGLLVCAFDEAMGAAVGNLLRRPAVTGRLETDFRRPVPVGSTLYIAAKLDGVAGRKIYVSADGRLGSETGPIALKARALFVIVEFEHFSTHGDPDAITKLSEAHEKAKAKRAAEGESWAINP